MDNIRGQQTDPVLIRKVDRDSSGRLIHVTNYNSFGIVSDTIYSSVSGAIITIDSMEYNSKGKLISWNHYWPPVYKGGYFNRREFQYESDTLLKVFDSYGMRGNLSIRTRHFYNSSGLPLVDSSQNFLTGTSAVLLYEYDDQRRILSRITLSSNGDTLNAYRYHYTSNTTEMEVTDFSVPSQKTVGKTITEYSPDGKMVSEKNYLFNQFTGGTDYTYDVAGRLIKKQVTNSSGTSEESYTYDSNGWLVRVNFDSNNRLINVYTNNPLSGKPEKMERYYDGKITGVTTYYYQ
jgi:antitoxin component YwqK of YwqJK toxin-antitoxin module